MLRYLGVIAMVGLSQMSSVPAQTPECGAAANTAAEMARRRTAIVLARQINTAEAQAWSSYHRYEPADALTDITVPDGFDLQISTDGTTYAFSIKDTQDPCKAAVFSDQIGTIYNAFPLR